MIEKISLRIFWTAMLGCASSVIVLVWIPKAAPLGQSAATLFVIGLASFLIWAPLMAYRFLYK